MYVNKSPFLRYLHLLELFLSRSILKAENDITIIIPVKNRFDYRIKNALKSIRNQDYDPNLIKIVVVDYDSNKELIQKYSSLCEQYNADYLRIEDKPVWCKSHALNIAIKRAKTKYILCTDVDVIFEKDYIKEAIKELKKNYFQVLLSHCFDLPKGSEDLINKLEFKRLKSMSKVRKWEGSPGICLTLTYFFHRIKGYDEEYKLWGREDDDLLKRFELYGLTIKNIKDNAVYLHQWHPKYEGIKINKKQINKNEQHFSENNSIIRNKEGWGEID